MKPELQDLEDWKNLVETLEGKESAKNFQCKNQFLELLRKALEDPSSLSLGPKDKLVRLRQALRFGSIKLGLFSLPFPELNGWPRIEEYLNFNLDVVSKRVKAKPWEPKWIQENREVDRAAVSLEERPWSSVSVESDPWTQEVFGYPNYTGVGQALAVRSVLNMPENKTLLVILPTGEGKSLIYQALWKSQKRKTIAVVVPTITLAQDQESEIHRNPKTNTDRLHAYIGGEDKRNSTIKAAIPSGEQGLFFSSPKAIVGGLSATLIDAAERGNLGALVIDEAHLVHAWGTDFISEYQELAALVSELRNRSPDNKKPKIICLSATVDTESLKTLESFFSLPGNPISIISAARLRNEQEIWVSPPIENETEREQKVLEALMNLPRPAILYSTEIKDVDNWYEFVTKEGFSNVEKVHGDTKSSEKERTVKKWKSGILDLVVGNTAFGLGINYQSARTVIHACIPEDISRYYQEIGRTGRDNLASISLILPTKSDKPKAKRNVKKRLITTEIGLPRWEEMFLTSKKEEGFHFIDTSKTPSTNPLMAKGDWNQEWNHRILNFMQLCGVIQMCGTKYIKGGENEEGKTLMKVLIKKEKHTKEEFWKDNIESRKIDIHKSGEKGFDLIEKLLKAEICPSFLFEEFFTLEDKETNTKYELTLGCGGCKVCRSKNEDAWHYYPQGIPNSVWGIGQVHNSIQLYFGTKEYYITYIENVFTKRRRKGDLAQLINKLWIKGLRKLIYIGVHNKDNLKAILKEHPWSFVCDKNPNILTRNSLPPGPEIIWIDLNIKFKSDHLRSEEKTKRIFFIPDKLLDPDYEDELFTNRRAARCMDVETFLRRIDK